MFESVYGSRDYFALLSSSLNRNNYFDVTSQSQYIQIGARFEYRVSISIEKQLILTRSNYSNLKEPLLST